MRHVSTRLTVPRCRPVLCEPSAIISRRGAVRGSVFAAWACTAAVSISRVADFPPAGFRAIVTGVYADALQPCDPGARVLEIGAGPKCASVFERRFRAQSDVTALDIVLPDEAVLRDATAVARQQGYAYSYVQGDVTDLSGFADESFDAVLCSLTLCSVSDVDAAVAEVLRVLARGGRFGFVEHVRVREGEGRPVLALSQRLLEPLQVAVAHNCHLTRPSDELVRQAFEGGGGRVVRMERMLIENMWPVSQQAAGVVEKAR